jgi:competence protein ComEC
MGSVRSWMIIVCAAIISVVFLPELPTLSFFLLLLLPVLAGIIIKPARRFIPILLPLLFGLLWATSYGYLGLKQQLPKTLEGADVWVEGEVVGLPVVRDRSQRFELQVLGFDLSEQTELAGKAVEQSLQKVRINWYQTSQRVEPGERWRLLLRLKRPHGFANSGGFDYQGWLFQQGIGATGYVRKHEGNRRMEKAGYHSLLDQWRFQLYQRLSERLDSSPSKGLMLALLMGERGDVSNSQWQLLSRTGTNHLFVISGLHVGFVALCAYLMFFNLSRLLLIGPPRFAAQQVGVCAALFSSFVYAAIAGFSLPTQRALIMLVVMLAGRLLRRRVDVLHSYWLALLLVLLWDPLAPQSVGFWLSFGAVGSLLYAFGLRTDNRGIWWRWFRPQLVVFVAFVPVLLFFFQQVSLVSPLANIFAIPIVGLFMVPLCVLVVVLEILSALIDLAVLENLAGLLSWLSNNCLALVISFLNLLSELPVAQWANSLGLWALLCATAGMLLLLAPRGLPARWLALCCFLPLFAGDENQPPAGAFEITVLDVGQGLAVHIRTRNHHLIYDVGARFNDKFDMASSVILPYLRKQSIASLDRVVVSHGDNDHAGSLPALLAGIPVVQVVSGASERSENAIACQDGFSWQWDQVTFQLMQADSAFWNNENNRSCVLKVSSDSLSVLIPGDIEKQAEFALLEEYAEALSADVLLAPHHGSLSSSSETFLDQVKPNLVIVSSGYRNRFGHPHSKVMARYQQRQIKVLNTANQGALHVSNSQAQSEPVVESYRQTFKRYWF